MTLNKFSAGIAAGFAATIVLSLIMLAKTAIGLMPELNVVRMLANFVNGELASGWILHFVIGTLGQPVRDLPAGLVIGPMAPVMTLVLHLVFGAIMGLTYSKLRPGQPAGA